ncbi:hypothetical protein C9J01_22755 [Photobacterium rosenbergii]|uniref:TRAP transporter small permease protein n=1 Tax=Photobacterium rosenbergii TaxID=294936 RepID=A0A2T3N705_9GAMM|nr:TRAP transporter small permease [Photobacterium rosenbergii]PSW08683.1 hypothetical protein C9J01_22755 [Photobacterium rosenbergii]
MAVHLYGRAMDRLENTLMFAGMVLLVAMVISIITGVSLRFFIGSGSGFAEPISKFFLVQITFYGTALCYRRSEHLRVSLLNDWLEGTKLRVLEIFQHLLVMVFAICLVRYGIDLVDRTWFQRYPEITWLRVGLVYTAVPAAGALVALFSLEKLLGMFVSSEEVCDAQL